MKSRCDRRNWTRLDKMFPVLVESPLFGFMNCIARNISPGGIFLEINEPLPLGSSLRIYFSMTHEDASITASGEVKNHYFLNFASKNGLASITGMGVRFTQFDNNGEEIIEKSIHKIQNHMN